MPSEKRLARSRRHFALRTDMPKQAWHNRIVGTGEESPDQLLANPRNFRVHPKHQQDALEGVLNEVGWVDDVIVNQRTGFVIDGHLRVSLAQRRGEMVPVKYVDLDEHEEALILATFDPISALAATDAAQLDALLREVSTSDAAVMQMLSDLAEQEGVIGFGEPEAGLTDPDEVPEPPSDPITKPGDLWILGRHRLLCGDSTKREDVDRLMDGEKADLLMTDPPYGIDAPKMTLGTGKKQFYRGDWDGALLPIADMVSVASCACVWGGNYYADSLAVTNDWLAWHKKNDGLTFSEFELAWTNFGKNTRLFSHHWSGEIKQHPTQKPVEVITWAIELAPTSDTVLDLFGGSGSTLIACEQTERVCRMMELDPHYCDVIVQRWENFTGQQAHREAVS